MDINPDIDPGIEIAHALHRGKQLTCEQIAAYADSTPQTILNIEKKALAKVRKLLRREGIAGDLAEALRG